MNNNQLTKKDKYLLKKQQKEQERLQKARRKKIKKIITISLPIVLIAGGVIWGMVSYLSREKEEVHLGSPQIEINPSEYDAGTVSLADGLVKYTYEIDNIGQGDLKIDRIWTSCMCTTARLKIGDKTSSEFNMHSNPIFWSQSIAPGEKGYLEVTFDPAYHGSAGLGPLIRVVYLSTNDPQKQEVEVKLLVNVIK